VWTVLLFLSQAVAQPCTPSPPPADATSLVVQAVDATWLPLPGMAVTITSPTNKRQKHTSMTKRDGFAEFWLPRGAEYTIEVGSPGFKSKRIKDVHIGPVLEYTSTAYVQVQLQVAAPREIIE
jgi:hypothetical protein